MKTRMFGVRVAVAATAAVAALVAANPLLSTDPVSLAATTAQDPGALLQDELNRKIAENALPGAIGMTRNGDDVQHVGAGFGDMFMRVPADPHAKFRIGSNTKAFVATVVLQLEHEGKLSLDDTVDRWLPGVVAAGGNDGTKITIRQLLNHTSLIPDYLANTEITVEVAADLDPYKKFEPRQLVEVGMARGVLEQPTYSNTNYILAGMVIEAVTGRTPATEVQNRIIAPLGLDDTTYPESDPKLYGNWLHGYFAVRDVSFSNVTATGAAAAIVSTETDLADFTRALLSGKLLPAAQLDKMMQTEEVLVGGNPKQMGLGIHMIDTPCGPAWGHTGSVLGYMNAWISSPDGAQQALVAVNRGELVNLPLLNPAAAYSVIKDAYCAMRG